MKKTLMTLGIALAVAAGAAHAQDSERKVTMKELPPAVQKAITDYAVSHGATVRGVAAETEKGKHLFEAELSVKGRNRDVTFDEEGAVFTLEEEVPIAQIPAGARTSIEKAAAGGTITMVEAVTEKGNTIYEGHIAKGGKRSEVKVNAAGEVVK